MALKPSALEVPEQPARPLRPNARPAEREVRVHELIRADGPPSTEGKERRRSPRRRLRDRVASLDTSENPDLHARTDLKNLMMLIDDDLRETALAIGSLEGWLGDAMKLVEKEGVTPAELRQLAEDPVGDDHVDTLAENLEKFRRRIALVAHKLD